MKTRIIPCTECRIRRRKCLRINIDKCERCEQLGLVCLQTSNKKKNDRENTTTTKQLDIGNLHDQVAELEWAIQQMEWQLNNTNNNKAEEEEQNSLVHRRPENHRSDYLSESVWLNLISHKWQFKIKNGQFQIETGINNLSDLLPYFGTTNSNISYLSPLRTFYSSDFDDENSNSQYSSNNSSSHSQASHYLEGNGSSGLLIQFGSENDEDMVPFTTKLLNRCAKIDAARRPTYNYYQPPTQSLYPDYTTVMDRLIRTFFSCVNTIFPILHEAYFMKSYEDIIVNGDPLDDLICVSICCFMCCTSTCDHFHFFSAKDKRYLADFFFAKAKSIILDQFDDPEKRLENVISVNFLSRYLHHTLKIKDCHELNHLAYQICVDLSREYELKDLSFTRDCNLDYAAQSASPEDVPTRPLTDHDVQYMLFSRHVTLILSTQRLMDNLTNTASKTTQFNFPYWQLIEDEPHKTRKFIQTQNWLLKLLNHPFISHFMAEAQKVQLGTVCTLSFDSIVRVEDAVTEWSASVPDEYRLCANYLDTSLCIASIKKTTDVIVLLSFMHYLVMTTLIYSSLLKPVAVRQDTDELLSYVQRHSLDKSLAGCRLLLYCVDRIAEIDDLSSESHNTHMAIDFLQHMIDVLIFLSVSNHPYISKEAKNILRQCLDCIAKLQLQSHDRVPANISPIHTGSMNMNNASTFDLDFYDQYPDPWSALMYDASLYILTSNY